MLKSFLVFTFLGAFLSACPSTETVESTRVPAAGVYQSYSISASKRQTSVYAVFRLNNETGKTIDLDAPAKIDLNGKPMTEIAPTFANGTTYEAKSSGFLPKQQFAFTDAAGKVYRNEIALQALEIPVQKIVLSRTKVSLIKLSRAVAPDEQISVSVTGKAVADKTPLDKTVEASPDESRTNVSVAPESLKEFMTGAVTVNVMVEKKESLKQATPSGGALRFVYQSAEAAAKITK
ncbi:MAG TPA: hypothetical protein VF604_08825 [Pyrinomonadaceae bacterium]|jgi:hypothetical protein